MKDGSAETPWRPKYPASRDKKVILFRCDLQTYISDRRPGITVIDFQLDSPACFWIDHSHLYLRANWEQWCTVSQSDPDQVAAICSSHYCHITQSLNNVICDFTAPVYRIKELPPEIFASKEEQEGKEEEEETEETSEEETPDSQTMEVGSEDYQECLSKVMKIVQEKCPGLDLFPNLNFDGDHAAIAVSTEDKALLLDLLPENRDFQFFSETGENLHNPMDKWASDLVFLDFVTKLKRIRKRLKQTMSEDEGEVRIGLVANRTTLDNLRGIAEFIELGDLNLFTYDNLADGVNEMFSDQDAN